MGRVADTAIAALLARRVVSAERTARNTSKLDGPVGPQGEQGPQGESGPMGLDGPRGEKGERGERGPIGETGEQGQRGETGPIGETGPRGEVGPQGAVGAKGDKGEKGDQGDIGPPPDHQWNGTKLRFQKPGGKWGKYTDLKGDKGEDGQTRIVVRGGVSSGGAGLDAIPPGSEGVEPTSIAVMQGGQWVGLPWAAFITIIAGAVDMGSEYSRRTDFVGQNTLYRGEAPAGSIESAEVWRIRRIEFVAGVDGQVDVVEKWAEGTTNMVHAWSDRLALNYT